MTTGHTEGLITRDLAKSDDARREQRRAEPGEPYRTLLEQFRHEIGHHAWPIAVEQRGLLERGRQPAMSVRLTNGRSTATTRPGHRRLGTALRQRLRDDASSGGLGSDVLPHYLHIRDTVETAADFGIVVTDPRAANLAELAAAPDRAALCAPFRVIIQTWLPLAYALNAINRSMGAGERRAFALAVDVIRKLAFVHDHAVQR